MTAARRPSGGRRLVRLAGARAHADRALAKYNHAIAIPRISLASPPRPRPSPSRSSCTTPSPPSPAEAAANHKRAEAIVRVLTSAGATDAKIKIEQAGTSAPFVDPKDARRRERNKRPDVVFVSSS